MTAMEKKLLETLEEYEPFAESRRCVVVSGSLVRDLIAYFREKIVRMTICDCCGLEHPEDDSKCPRCGRRKEQHD